MSTHGSPYVKREDRKFRIRDLRMMHCWIWKWKMRPAAKEFRWLLRARRDKETESPLEPPEGV